MAIFVVCFFSYLFLISSTTTVGAAPCSERCLHQTKAAYFPSAAPISSAGGCGYGSLAKGFNNGYIAAGVPSLFRDGVGCGACFHVRCKNEKLCRRRGTKVVLTDNHKGNNKTELVLSDRAFISMASTGKARKLLKLGIVEVEYRRIPCEYHQNQNISVRVEKSSKRPNNLAITFLYQGGQTEIGAVDAFDQFGRSSFMSRNHGAVWEISPVPEGPLMLRLLIILGYDRAMVMAENALPTDWKVGKIYDLGVQTNAIDARDGCSPDCTDAKP